MYSNEMSLNLFQFFLNSFQNLKRKNDLNTLNHSHSLGCVRSDFIFYSSESVMQNMQGMSKEVSRPPLPPPHGKQNVGPKGLRRWFRKQASL